MKTASDPRHLKRIRLMQHLFACAYHKKPDAAVRPIWSKLDIIDRLITKAAPEWPLERINHIDLAILRLATWELVIDKTVPLRVIIDESVELAKEFGSDSSPNFVNGVLGTLAQHMQVREAIIAFLANESKLDPATITVDTLLSDLNWQDSMLQRLQEALDVTLPEGLPEMSTVGELLEAFDPKDSHE